MHAAASGVKSEGTIETVDYLLKHGAMKILNKPSSEEESVKKMLIILFPKINALIISLYYSIAENAPQHCLFLWSS